MNESPIAAEDLADWLIDRGFAEDRRGYGHATGDEIAEALLAEFEIRPSQKEPS